MRPQDQPTDRPFKDEAAKFLEWRKPGPIFWKPREPVEQLVHSAPVECTEVFNEQDATIPVLPSLAPESGSSDPGTHSRHTLTNLACERCGNTFEHNVWQGRVRRYCSERCQKQAMRYQRGPATACPVCAKTFFPNLVGSGDRQLAQTCSRSCAGTWANRLGLQGRPRISTAALTAARHEGRPCQRCGGTARYNRNNRCVACCITHERSKRCHEKPS
jgi:hypothetical protein